MATFTACILIDARSAGALLPRQLAMAAPLGQDGDPAVRLKVIDDTGDPRLPRLVQRFGARLQTVAAQALGQRLNRAIAQCGDDVLVFPGTDGVASADALKQLILRVAGGELDVAVLPDRPLGPLAWLKHRLWRRAAPGTPSLCLSRRWFERIGGCDPELDGTALSELLGRLRACGARVGSQQSLTLS